MWERNSHKCQGTYLFIYFSKGEQYLLHRLLLRFLFFVVGRIVTEKKYQLYLFAIPLTPVTGLALGKLGATLNISFSGEKSKSNLTFKSFFMVLAVWEAVKLSCVFWAWKPLQFFIWIWLLYINVLRHHSDFWTMGNYLGIITCIIIIKMIS